MRAQFVRFVPVLLLFTFAGCVTHRPPQTAIPVLEPETVVPPGPDDHVRAGLLAARSGDTELAMSLFLDALALDPRHARARFAIAVTRGQAGDLADAEAEVQALLGEDADHVGAYSMLARSYLEHDRFAMVLLVVEMADDRLVEDPEAHNMLGLAYLALGDPGLASAEFQRTLALDPTHLEANLNLGFLVLEFGAYSRAHACFQSALGTDPDSVDARLGLAIALRGLADLESAVAEYDRILRQHPDHRLALLNKAAVLDLAGDHETAMLVMDRYVAVHGSDGGEERIEASGRT